VLEDNGILSRGVHQLAEGLFHNRTLQTVDLSHNRVGMNAQAIGEVRPVSCCLPRHTMPFSTRHQGLITVLLTWRTPVNGPGRYLSPLQWMPT
jgi:hypothetical protein